MFAVDQIVRSHNGPRVRLAHGDLERLEVEFSQRPLLDKRVYSQSVGLLLIADEIYTGWSAGTACIRDSSMEQTLDRGCDAFLLQAPDVLSRQLAREKRILGEGLEVPASQRMAVHANSRGEEDMG